MAKPKNQNISSKFHTSRTRIKSSHLAHGKKLNRQIFKMSRRTVLTIIVMAMLTVILAILLSIFNNPEHLIKRQLSSMATSYYEESFYPELITNSASFNETMERYSTTGLSRISARQLLLFDNEYYSKSDNVILQYCDENDTFVQIYPDPPYGRTDYHIEYHYACTF